MGIRELNSLGEDVCSPNSFFQPCVRPDKSTNMQDGNNSSQQNFSNYLSVHKIQCFCTSDPIQSAFKWMERLPLVQQPWVRAPGQEAEQWLHLL